MHRGVREVESGEPGFDELGLGELDALNAVAAETGEIRMNIRIEGMPHVADGTLRRLQGRFMCVVRVVVGGRHVTVYAVHRLRYSIDVGCYLGRHYRTTR